MGSRSSPGSGALHQFVRRGLVDLVEDGGRHVTLRDLAQRDDGRLVVFELDHGIGAMGDAPRSLCSNEHHLENVVDVFEAVFDGNSGHLWSSFSISGRLAPNTLNSNRPRSVAQGLAG